MVSIHVAVALSAALICFEVANGQSEQKEFNNEDFDTEGPSPDLPGEWPPPEQIKNPAVRDLLTPNFLPKR